MSKQLKADFLLVLVTMGWGLSYYMMDLCLTDISPFTLNAYRFSAAFILMFIFTFPKLKTVNKVTMKYSLLVGIALGGVYILVAFGVANTSISNAGFLCGLAVVFTPILAFLFKKQIPDKKLILVILMCLMGVALLTLNNRLIPAFGDILCLASSVIYAADLLITETAVAKTEVNAFQLGVFQLGFSGLLNLILSFIVEEPALPSCGSVWAALCYLVCCTAFVYIAQPIAQQYTSASHVSVIFSLEPLFSAIAAFFLAGEVLLPKGYLGAALLLAAIFVMNLDVKKLFGKKKAPM